MAQGKGLVLLGLTFNLKLATVFSSYNRQIGQNFWVTAPQEKSLLTNL
jgi:hypothetical protein